MKERTTQLKVVKADGAMEQYLHTKVLGTIANAFSASGQDSMFVAEELAEAVTFYLYNTHKAEGKVSTSEIYFMLQAMLTSTGYEEASLSLHNYHFSRALTRRRIEVVDTFLGENPQNWNKSCIAFKLVSEGMKMCMARTIAGLVEERILKIGLTKVPRNLISELVEIEKHSMAVASVGLESVEHEVEEVRQDMEVCAGHVEQNGLLAKAG